jgi:anti-sigma B factor antagonist
MNFGRGRASGAAAGGAPPRLYLRDDSRVPATPRIEPFAGGAVIALSGELDAFDAPVLRDSFQELLESEPAVIVLDLSNVSFLDSTVLGAIVGLLRRVREGDGELRTVLPDTTARRIFEITNLVAVLDVWPTREAAVAGTV